MLTQDTNHVFVLLLPIQILSIDVAGGCRDVPLRATSITVVWIFFKQLINLRHTHVHFGFISHLKTIDEIKFTKCFESRQWPSSTAKGKIQLIPLVNTRSASFLPSPAVRSSFPTSCLQTTRTVLPRSQVSSHDPRNNPESLGSIVDWTLGIWGWRDQPNHWHAPCHRCLVHNKYAVQPESMRTANWCCN